MRTYKTETITREEKVVDVFSCDLCGRASPSPYDWASKHMHDLITQIELRDTTYETGLDSSGTITSADVCPECFVDKVVPALEAIGLKFRMRDVIDND
jgi:hypothetical protein